MATHALVPKLVVSENGEPLLPNAAEGEIEVWPGNDGFEAYGYESGGHLWAYLPGLAAFRFRRDESTVVAFPDAEFPPDVIEDCYYRNVLPLVLQLRGHEVLHASAVVGRKGVVVLCGHSGAGKSTFAFALSARGYTVWADDAVVLDVGERDVTAIQVPFRLGLRPQAQVFFSSKPGDRRLQRVAPTRSPVLGLVILERSEGSDTSLVDANRLAPTAAFTELLPHAYYFRLSDAAGNAAMLDRYLRLAATTPTFHVRYRPGLRHISAVLDEIADGVLAPSPPLP